MTVKLILCLHSYFIGTKLYREHQELIDAHVDFWEQLQKLMTFYYVLKYMSRPSRINVYLRNRFNSIKT